MFYVGGTWAGSIPHPQRLHSDAPLPAAAIVFLTGGLTREVTHCVARGTLRLGPADPTPVWRSAPRDKQAELKLCEVKATPIGGGARCNAVDLWARFVGAGLAQLRDDADGGFILTFKSSDAAIGALMGSGTGDCRLVLAPRRLGGSGAVAGWY